MADLVFFMLEEITLSFIVGKVFLQTIRTIFDDAIGESKFSDEKFILEGNKIELWLLKILCGLGVVSGKVVLPKKWINILFGRETLPKDAGLYFFGVEGDVSWNFNLVRVISVLDNQEDFKVCSYEDDGSWIITLYDWFWYVWFHLYNLPIFHCYGYSYGRRDDCNTCFTGCRSIFCP